MAEMQKIVVLPLRKVVQTAWSGLRVRLVKTVLVTACIALAITFLTYILYSNGFGTRLEQHGSNALIERLAREGVLEQILTESRGIQTYWLVGIALLISLAGIVNAMLISVTERFREIGTMKCLGALDSFIVKLYLTESLFQGLVGTAAGWLLGIVLAYAEGRRVFGPDVWSLIPIGAVLKIAVISLTSGILLTIGGALYPAWRAAAMEPVDAMRSEV